MRMGFGLHSGWAIEARGDQHAQRCNFFREIRNSVNEGEEASKGSISHLSHLWDLGPGTFMYLHEPKTAKGGAMGRTWTPWMTRTTRAVGVAVVPFRGQGAIGSEFKIDASYLSPNVNMAARLEAGRL